MTATAVVTGAGSGIGRAVALHFASRGYDVALVGRSRAPLDDVAREIGKQGRRAYAIECDVSRPDEVASAAAVAAGALGPPHLAVLCAGIVKRALVHETDVAVWDEVIATNLTGTFLCARAFLPAMLAAKAGRIVALGSISSTVGTARASAYNASKWAVVGFVKSLAEELRGTGVQAMCVLPGSVDTPMLEGSGYDPKMSADEVARVVAFAALDAPAAMNGSAIEVFG